jgi:hypothetical protein
MATISKASRLWLAGVLVNTAMAAPAAMAQNRCVADLGRVDNAFCLSDRNTAEAGAQPLSYQWRVNDGVFDLAAKACITDGQEAGRRPDLVIAIDRSKSLAATDAQERKLLVDPISVTRRLLDRLAAEAATAPAAAPLVGLTLFSSAPDCRLWAGGAIVIDREFPCVYLPAKSIADAAHLDSLRALLTAADGKFSQGSLPRRSDYGLVGGLIATDAMALQSSPATALVMFGDGMAYAGASSDPYPYLRSANYAAAQKSAVDAFSAPAVRRYKMLFALRSLPAPVFGPTYADAYDTMCGGGIGTAADCTAPGIVTTDPRTWPVNKLQPLTFAQSLVALSGGGPTEVVSLKGPDSLDQRFDALRQTTANIVSVDSVGVSVNGGERRPGRVEGGRVVVEGLPVDQAISLDLFLGAAGREVRVPMTVGLEAVPYEPTDLLDKEMFCKADAPPADAPKPTLSDLQGGSGSCGVIASPKATRRTMMLFVLLVPLLFVLIRTRILSGFTVSVLALTAGVFFFWTGRAAAEESQGLNALQYRPVVDGVGSTETATALPPGTFNAGAFVDYANDPVELGGEKGKRLESVMDDLVTAHATFNVGLFDRVGLGADFPYVHTSDVDRSVEGEEVEGGHLGRPADATAFLKINALRRESWSLGFMPMATMPTGEPSLLLGDGTANYGALALVSGSSGELGWAFNMGYLQRNKPLVHEDDRARRVVVRGQSITSGGVDYRVTSWASVAPNFQLKVSAGENIDFARTNPAEWSASGKLRPMSGLELALGAGTGIGKGYGSPDYRVFAGIAYVPAASQTRGYERRIVDAPAAAPAVAARPAPAAVKSTAKPAAPVKPAVYRPAPKAAKSAKPAKAAAKPMKAAAKPASKAAAKPGAKAAGKTTAKR